MIIENQIRELSDWLNNIKLDYAFETDRKKAIILRCKYIKLKRIYDRMTMLQKEWKRWNYA